MSRGALCVVCGVCSVVWCVLVDVCWSKCCSAQGDALQETNHVQHHGAADIQKETFSGFSENCRATCGKNECLTNRWPGPRHRHVLPCTFGLMCVEAPQPGSVRQPGLLCLRLRCVEFSLSSCDISDFVPVVFMLRDGITLFHVCDRGVRDRRAFVALRDLLPCLVCCLGCFLQLHVRSKFLAVIEVSRKAVEATSIKLSRRATKCCSGNSPALVASRIMSWLRGLAATRAPRCAGRSTPPDPFHPSPDWPLLSVACCVLSSMNRGKRLSSEPCPTSSKGCGRRFLSENGVAMYPEDLIDSADTWTSTEKSKFCLRILTQLNTFAHGSDDRHQLSP